MTIKSILLIFLSSVMLVSCGGGGGTDSPRNLDDACSILDQNRTWLRHMRNTEDKWGVPVSMQMAFLHQESKFQSRAKTPLKYSLGFIPKGRVSSAYGYAQVIDSTWEWYKDETGKRFARRDRFDHAVEFMGWYMNITKKRNGVAVTNAYYQYIAYHEGHTGFRRKSHQNKPWLLRVAQSVQDRTVLYGSQLRYCT